MPDAPGFKRIADAIETALDAACIEVVVTHDGQPAGLYNVACCLDKAGLIDWSAFDDERPAGE